MATNQTGQHSPAPWKYTGGSACITTVDEVPTRYIARYVDPWNAALIAAAPDLLEALVAMHEHFGVLEDNMFLNEDAVAASKAARAAIAKARGEQVGAS